MWGQHRAHTHTHTFTNKPQDTTEARSSNTSLALLSLKDGVGAAYLVFADTFFIRVSAIDAFIEV